MTYLKHEQAEGRRRKEEVIERNMSSGHPSTLNTCLPYATPWLPVIQWVAMTMCVCASQRERERESARARKRVCLCEDLRWKQQGLRMWGWCEMQLCSNGRIRRALHQGKVLKQLWGSKEINWKIHLYKIFCHHKTFLILNHQSLNDNVFK